ncbi:MAG: glycosyltransferase [Verrucomicrobiaceae bacterium]|nr:MAG: glycosyltransferase [Verrucomicrobiaceae bacterium]
MLIVSITEKLWMSDMRVLNIFNSLVPSGAEVMWSSAAEDFKLEGVTHIIAATADTVGPYGEDLRKHYEVVHLPLGEGVWGARATARFAQEIGADVIHCHSEKKALACGLAGRITRLPVVRTYHNVWPSKGFKHAIRRRIERRLVSAVGVGKSVSDMESHWGSVQTILNWVDTNSIIVRNARNGTSLPLRLVTVCNTHSFKRCDIMLQLVEKHPEVTLTHIGRDIAGAFRDEELIRQGVDERVRSLGSRDDVLELLGSHDAFLCTSDNEGFGVAMYEALLTGLAVVIVDKPGVRDIRKFAPQALVINPESEFPLEGLAESICRQSTFFGEFKHQLHSQFSPGRGAAEYAQVYRKVTAK